jgi:hypothetical protein
MIFMVFLPVMFCRRPGGAGQVVLEVEDSG